MKKNNVFPIFVILIMVGLMLPNIISIIKGPAPTPDVFAAGYSLTDANRLSQEQGKPMFVVATLDSCPPCQKLKRTTMIDPKVVDWINEYTIPVYLEYSEHPEDISMLPVRSYPTTMLIENDQILASMVGAMSSEQLISEFTKRLPD